MRIQHGDVDDFCDIQSELFLFAINTHGDVRAPERRCDMKTRFLASLLGLAVVCGSKPARAADDYCRDIAGEEDIALATVGGGHRVNFVSGKTDRRRECPSDRPSCRLKSYVVPRDAVLVGGSIGGFRCVTVRSAKGTVTSGFLPKAVLVEAPPTTPRLGDWTGEWVRDREASITIEARDDALSVRGASAYGELDPKKVEEGQVYYGGFDKVARPRGNLLIAGADYDGSKRPAEVDADYCLVRLRLFARYLAVDDNNLCGGDNVTFTGVYSRRP